MGDVKFKVGDLVRAKVENFNYRDPDIGGGKVLRVAALGRVGGGCDDYISFDEKRGGAGPDGRWVCAPEYFELVTPAPAVPAASTLRPGMRVRVNPPTPVVPIQGTGPWWSEAVERVRGEEFTLASDTSAAGFDFSGTLCVAFKTPAPESKNRFDYVMPAAWVEPLPDVPAPTPAEEKPRFKVGDLVRASRDLTHGIKQGEVRRVLSVRHSGAYDLDGEAGNLGWFEGQFEPAGKIRIGDKIKSKVDGRIEIAALSTASFIEMEKHWDLVPSATPLTRSTVSSKMVTIPSPVESLALDVLKKELETARLERKDAEARVHLLQEKVSLAQIEAADCRRNWEKCAAEVSKLSGAEERLKLVEEQRARLEKALEDLRASRVVRPGVVERATGMSKVMLAAMLAVVMVGKRFFNGFGSAVRNYAASTWDRSWFSRADIERSVGRKSCFWSRLVIRAVCIPTALTFIALSVLFVPGFAGWLYYDLTVWHVERNVEALPVPNPEPGDQAVRYWLAATRGAVKKSEEVSVGHNKAWY